MGVISLNHNAYLTKHSEVLVHLFTQVLKSQALEVGPLSNAQQQTFVGLVSHVYKPLVCFKTQYN
jgi:hypothetical protein